MSLNQSMEENNIIKLAKKIYQLTDRMCSVGPGPSGFGISNINSAEIGIFLDFGENPVQNDTIFPDEVDGYEISICAFHKKDQRVVSKDELPVLTESKNAATRKIASAFHELSKETQYVTTKECRSAFAEMIEVDLIIGRRSDRQENAEVRGEEENVPVAKTEMWMDM